MTARITIERILRDDDDASGHTVREWKIDSEPGHITIRPKDGATFLLIRPGDADILAADLQRAKEAALSLRADT